MTKFLRTGLRGSHLWKLLFLLLLAPSYAQAQVSAYTFTAVSGTFTPLPASATPVPVILGDDIISGILPIGFSFVFDGATYTDLKASSNGFLSFNPLAGSNLSNQLAGTGAANEKPLVAPLWDDLDGRPTGVTAVASYLTTGTAPNRVFTFEWLNWEWYYTSSSANVSFQAKLYEGTNRIEFTYRPEPTPPVGNLSASIGLASGTTTGCAGEFLSLNNTSTSPTASSTTETNTIATVPAAGQIYRFTPPPPTMGTCAAVRCANMSNVTGTSAQVNFNGNSSATSYTVTYQATGGPVLTVTPAPTASPVSLTGLSINTTYTVRIVANCASGPSTTVTLTFTTSNGYCVTGLGGFCGGNDVTDVSIIGTTLAATGLTCNTTPGGAYTNYPAVPPTTGTVNRGTSYPISVTTTGGSIISAWIDSNHNLAFEPSEWVQVDLTSTAGSASVASITIPPTGPGNTYLGPTGFRVRSRLSGNPNGAGDACLAFGSGEAKDFTITIAPEPPCPAPTSLNATAITASGATLNFTPASGTGTYSLVYGMLGFNPATSGTTVNPATSPVTVTGLQAGTTYQFYVQRNCGALGLSVNTGPINFTTTIVNDNPCGATTLPINLTGCLPYATTSIGATTTAPNGYTNPTTGCGIGSAPRDVWFKFTTPASGSGSTDVRVSVSGNAASVVQALSATSCNGPFTFIRCAGTTNNVAAPNLDLNNLVPNTTYYVRVFGYTPASQPGNFTICVTPLPSCPTPTGAAAINITKNSATLTYTAGTGGIPAGSTYTVIYGPPGFNPNTSGTSVSGIAGTSVPLTGLIPDTQYCYYLRLICGGLNGNSNQIGPICFQTLLESPANDEPCGAVSLTSGGAAVSGNTVGATTSTQNGINLPACSPAQSPRDVWYTVTTPPAAVGVDSLIITLTGTAVGMVRVYTSPSCANGPFTDVTCRAATGSNVGFSGPIRLGGLLPGTTYYLAVSGYGSSDPSGTFGITVRTVYVGPTCNPVTALTTGSITTTSASLSFVPGTNNTSYTVTYGPTGGSSTTITQTGSPVALTGLTAGTAYTVTVTPQCANGGSASGTTTTFTTTAPTCNPLTGLAAGSLTTTSAVLSFTSGAGNTSYTVTYSSGGPSTTVTPAPTSSPVTLSGLTASTTYTVTVTPVCAAGGTTTPATVTFTTPAPVCAAVTQLAVSSITSFTASAGFTPGAGNTSYTVTYTPMGGATVVVTASASPVALSGLQPNTAYTLSVTPNCSGGGTASATTTNFTTLTAPCAPVTQLAVTGVTGSTASVGFTAGVGNTSFTVSYTPTGGTATTLTVSGSPVALTGLTRGTNYTVSVTPICTGGGTAPATTTTFNTPLAIRNTLSQGAVTMAPNPAHHSFVLTVPALGPVRAANLTILNPLGQVVRQQALTLAATGTQATVDISGLAVGVYLVRLQTGTEQALLRLLVE